LELTPKEFQLLSQLATNPGKVYTREFLLEKIWGYEFVGDTRTVDVHIRHLRQKLEKDPSQPELIETIRGIGYRFKG
jgi:two-component system OmpR family response regulator/two-component system alkaline phosphatase synthesis response regulator PhoP